MKQHHLIRVHFLFFLLIPLTLKAQRKIFAAMFDGKPGIVEVDTSLKMNAPISKQPFVISTGLKVVECDKNGLPSMNEMKISFKLSETVEKMLSTTVKYTYAGTFASDCICFNYYFVEDTTGLRDKLAVLYKEKFPDRTLGLNFEEDKKWSTYFDFLYPGENYGVLNEPVFIKSE